MTAVLACTDGFISNVINRCAYGGRGAFILLFLKRRREKTKDEPGEEQENPGKKIHDPPPPADGQPPEAAVPLFLIFRLGF